MRINPNKTTPKEAAQVLIAQRRSLGKAKGEAFRRIKANKTETAKAFYGSVSDIIADMEYAEVMAEGATPAITTEPQTASAAIAQHSVPDEACTPAMPVQSAEEAMRNSLSMCGLVATVAAIVSALLLGGM